MMHPNIPHIVIKSHVYGSFWLIQACGLLISIFNKKSALLKKLF
jgi:hypothetical protein